MINILLRSLPQIKIKAQKNAPEVLFERAASFCLAEEKREVLRNEI